MKIPALPGMKMPAMNLGSLLSSFGINLADVEGHAKRVVAEAKQEIVNLHNKIDAQQRDISSLHTKLDALLRLSVRESITELITNGNGIDGNRGNENGNIGSASAASVNGGK